MDKKKHKKMINIVYRRRMSIGLKRLGSIIFVAAQINLDFIFD